MESSQRERIILKLEQEDWIRNNIAKLDYLTRLEKNLIAKVWAYSSSGHIPHIRRLAVALGCSPTGVSKAVRKLQNLKILQTASHSSYPYRREKFVFLSKEYPTWTSIVLHKLGFKNPFSNDNKHRERT